MASASSSGVGSGRTSSSGCPARTNVPASANILLTAPETLDLIEISFSGSIVPTASALSMMFPFETFTRGSAESSPFFDPPNRRNAATTRTTTPMDENIIFFFMEELRKGREVSAG